MEYELEIILRNQIPSDSFLCGENDEKDFEFIHQYKFSNGLTVIIGSNFLINSPSEIVENIELDLETINTINSPEELQEYYKDNYDIFYHYRDCVKIFKYYKNNELLIKQIIDYYKENDNINNSYQDEESENELDTDEEGYSSN